MTTWYSSDFHFGHANIIRYCNRPFSSVEEMDTGLIKNINQQAAPNDIIYFMGDWMLHREGMKESHLYESITKTRDQINCNNIHWLLGNHDPHNISHDITKLFTSVGYYREIKINKQFVVLSHYPMRSWNKSHRGSWMLYGHCHGTLPDDPTLLSIDVGVDCHNMKMLSHDDVANIMKRKKPIDQREQWKQEGKLWKTNHDIPEECLEQRIK